MYWDKLSKDHTLERCIAEGFKCEQEICNHVESTSEKLYNKLLEGKLPEEDLDSRSDGRLDKYIDWGRVVLKRRLDHGRRRVLPTPLILQAVTTADI